MQSNPEDLEAGCGDTQHGKAEARALSTVSQSETKMPLRSCNKNPNLAFLRVTNSLVSVFQTVGQDQSIEINFMTQNMNLGCETEQKIPGCRNTGR